MSGTGSPFSMRAGTNDVGGKVELSRNRNIVTRTQHSAPYGTRNRSRTPAKDVGKATLKTKIGRSPTPKRATCMKKSENVKSSPLRRSGDSRPRVTRLAYSKNPLAVSNLNKLSKLNLEYVASSKESFSGQKRLPSARERKTTAESTTTGNSVNTVQAPDHETKQYAHTNQSGSKFPQPNKHAVYHTELKQHINQQTASRPCVQKVSVMSQCETIQTIMSPSISQSSGAPSSSQRCNTRHSVSQQTTPISSLTPPHPVLVDSMISQPFRGSPRNGRREIRDTRNQREPKCEDGMNPMMVLPQLMQPSTSGLAEANVVTIPSDTYAACQAAFTYAAGTAAEAIDNVLVQLQVPTPSEGGITHVAKVVVPSTSGRGMTSALAVLHSSASNSSINSASSETESTVSTASTTSESEWDGGPKMVTNATNRDREGSRSAGLSRPSLLWGVSDDDEKLRPPSEG